MDRTPMFFHPHYSSSPGVNAKISTMNLVRDLKKQVMYAQASEELPLEIGMLNRPKILN